MVFSYNRSTARSCLITPLKEAARIEPAYWIGLSQSAQRRRNRSAVLTATSYGRRKGGVMTAIRQPAATLTITRGPEVGRGFDIGATTVTIGRHSACDIKVGGTRVSRRHACITWSGAGYIVEDLGSTNGTYVNGERVGAPRALISGDRLQLGEQVEFAFQVGESAPLRDGGLAVAMQAGDGSGRIRVLRILFVLGVALLVLAVAGLIMLSNRSYPSKTESAAISGEDFSSPTPTSTATPTRIMTRTPTPTCTATPTNTPRPPGSTPIPLTDTPRPQTNTPIPLTDTPRPQTSTPVPPTDTPSDVVIEAEWPPTMELDRADRIRLSLIRTADGVYVPTVEVQGHTVSVDTPIPAGTASAPPEKAFGTGYKAVAIARLDAAAFECSPPDVQPPRDLDQPQLKYEWNCLPKAKGPQPVNLRLDIQWVPREDGGEVIERVAWQTWFEIRVVEPWIKTDVLQLLTLGSSVFGVVLGTPSLAGLIKHRKERLADARSGYNIATIRKLLVAAFTPEGLRRFCWDLPAFQPVVNEFGPGHGLNDMVDRLIVYCRKNLLWGELLAEVKKVNPRQYSVYEHALRLPDKEI